MASLMGCCLAGMMIVMAAGHEAQRSEFYCCSDPRRDNGVFDRSVFAARTQVANP